MATDMQDDTIFNSMQPIKRYTFKGKLVATLKFKNERIIPFSAALHLLGLGRHGGTGRVEVDVLEGDLDALAAVSVELVAARDVARVRVRVARAAERALLGHAARDLAVAVHRGCTCAYAT